MFGKKQHTTPSPAEINRLLADAWTRLVEHYSEAQAKNQGVWNKTSHLGLLNFFLDRHNELRETLPKEYQKLENAMVEAAVARAREGQFAQPAPVELDLSMLEEVEKKAACWREILATYCRIHGRLKVEWMPWGEKDYQEFLGTVAKLYELEAPKAAAVRA